MTDIDKFFSDTDKILKQASKPGFMSSKTLARELSRNFQLWTRDYGSLGEALVDYWTITYGENLESYEAQQTAALWLAYALSLLNDSFSSEMDFTDTDWEAIREIISSEAGNMEMTLLSSLLTVIVERGKS